MRSIRLMFVLGAILLPFVFIGVVASAPPSPKHPKLAGIVSQLVEASENATQGGITPSAQAQASPDSPISPYIDTGLIRVDAPVVATIGDTEPKIADRAAVGVDQPTGAAGFHRGRRRSLSDVSGVRS